MFKFTFPSKVGLKSPLLEKTAFPATLIVAVTVEVNPKKEFDTVKFPPTLRVYGVVAVRYTYELGMFWNVKFPFTVFKAPLRSIKPEREPVSHIKCPND